VRCLFERRWSRLSMLAHALHRQIDGRREVMPQ
jgi:hypothetical protein